MTRSIGIHSELVELVNAVILKFPNKRFGEILYDATEVGDLYYLSDEDLIEKLRDYLNATEKH